MLESSTSPGNPATGKPENGQQLGDPSLPVAFTEEEQVRAEDAEPSWPGNRWPRQETFALLEIRSDMDSLFRDSTFKAPLWEEVSRKMGELGYSRSAKKCKEKFENIYKYHKRTRDGRSGRRSNGKAYRFFEQLEALDQPEKEMESGGNVILDAVPCSVHKPWSEESESSGGTRRKKRRMGRYLEKLMKEVVERQERLQRKFVEALEKSERDRVEREEAWKLRELERIKRESELLVQERSMAAAKDAAVLAFLKKIASRSEEGTIRFPEINLSSPAAVENNSNIVDSSTNKRVVKSDPENSVGARMSSSRWPKDQVDALIKLRTNLETNYQENGPKGPLWEDISADMRRLGYNRSAKRCKEKWENINKYFKRVKFSNKPRVEDSKTCPYFEQLDALYSKKGKNTSDSVDSGCDLRPEELLMHMMGGREGQGDPESVTEEDDGGGENEKNVDSNNQEQRGVEKGSEDFYHIQHHDRNNNVSHSMETME